MIVRIKYDFDRPNRVEVTNGLATLACIIAAIVALVERLYHADFALAIIGTTILSTASLIPFFIFYPIHKERRRRAKDAAYIVKNGEKLIGTIVSLKTIRMNEEFTYDIEYEWPKKNQKCTMTTPSVIPDRMFIKEKDLPLKVEIYAIQNKAHAYAIIDPPVVKMKARKMAQYISLAVMVLLLVLSWFLVFWGYTIPAVILITIIIGFMALIVKDKLLKE